mmetsp:Transcript_91278/g.263396  ORF Transcript_91278/g.263396 Transcript_91278/m.263396 type:complete len:364 (+) Transcript_91278:3-1094(+)
MPLLAMWQVAPGRACLRSLARACCPGQRDPHELSRGRTAAGRGVEQHDRRAVAPCAAGEHRTDPQAPTALDREGLQRPRLHRRPVWAQRVVRQGLPEEQHPPRGGGDSSRRLANLRRLLAGAGGEEGDPPQQPLRHPVAGGKGELRQLAPPIRQQTQRVRGNRSRQSRDEAGALVVAQQPSDPARAAGPALDDLVHGAVRNAADQRQSPACAGGACSRRLGRRVANRRQAQDGPIHGALDLDGLNPAAGCRREAEDAEAVRGVYLRAGACDRPRPEQATRPPDAQDLRGAASHDRLVYRQQWLRPELRHCPQKHREPQARGDDDRAPNRLANVGARRARFLGELVIVRRPRVAVQPLFPGSAR